MGKEKLEKQGALPRSLTVVSCAKECIMQMHDLDYLSDIDLDESMSLDGSSLEPPAGNSVITDGSLSS